MSYFGDGTANQHILDGVDCGISMAGLSRDDPADLLVVIKALGEIIAMYSERAQAVCKP